MKKSAKKFSLAMLLLAVVLLLSSCIPLAVALNLDNTTFESSSGSANVRLHFYTDSQLGAYKLGVRIGGVENNTDYCWMVDVDENHVLLYKGGYDSEHQIGDLDPDDINPSQLEGDVNFGWEGGYCSTSRHFIFNKVD